MRAEAGTAGLEVVDFRVERAGRQVVAVDHLSLAAGECAVIVAAAGTGKTSLAGALAGLVPATGTVRVQGRRCSGPASLRRRSGLALAVQDGACLAGCNVAEALALAAGQGREPELAFDVLPRLSGRAMVPVEFLSGGEQQLLRLACAWLASAGALVFDAPTVGLHGDAIEAVLNLTRRELARGASVLWLDQSEPPLAAALRLTIERGRVRGLAELQTESSTATD